MRPIRLILVCFILFTISAYAQNKNFGKFSSDFVSGYNALNLPQLELSYVSNLRHIGSAANIQKQLDFFNAINAGLAEFSSFALTAPQRTDYELIKYETGLNLQRLALEQKWVADAPGKISEGGIITVPNGKAWYAWMLKRWVNDEVTPAQVYQLGLGEIKKVQAHIEYIRRQTGLSEDAFYAHLNDPSFFIADPAEVQKAFENTKAIVYSNLHKLFSVTTFSELKIERGTAQAMAQTPGFYNNNTFYYNLFDKPYNKRQVDWLFLHEAVPGHHYQSSIVAQTKVSAVQHLFFYYGLAEGWGAYCESLGKQLGIYKTIYDELGRWEWDIVRSVRVPMDVGLNYYGWTDEQALQFWKQNIRGQDDIAMREIARLRRWPAQCITYKYGAAQILAWKNALQKQKGKAFDIKKFHDSILNHGSLPLFMVRENVFGEK